MKCPSCQTDNREGVKFCEECGVKMAIECPACGGKIPLGKKFCGECGAKLEAPSETAPIDFHKPRSYTPKFMAEKILTTRSSVEGERKIVTVLFSDIANYTSMSEKLDPEEVHQIMDGCFRILMDEIHRLEGTINQFTGDGVMALFGAPLAHEDHAQRACHASLAIQKALHEYSREVASKYGVDFKMRIGLNSGPVVVGSIGNDLRMDYTAVGDTTNLAARMESKAEPGAILLSENTHRLIREYFVLESLGKIEVKGKAEPQEVYELLGISDVVTRLDASAVKGLTRFLGRQKELEILQETFEKCLSRSGQVVGVVGEGGVGKSRLISEFREMLTKDYTYLEGRCTASGSAIPFLPFIDIAKSYFEINEGDGERTIKKKVKEGTAGVAEKLAPAIPAFHDLFSLPLEDEAYVRLEPREKRTRIFEALRDLLIWLSRKKPLVLTIDDLHWLDKSSEEFLDYLIGWLGNTGILLLLLYRPEYNHHWGSKSYYSRIGLDQLTTETSAELVRSILREGEVEHALGEFILERAAGNPLFMEELTRTLLENGAIEKKGDQFVLSSEITHVDVPDTVQGIIAARMDRLEDSIKRTMQIASVVGRDFAFSILQAVTGSQDKLKSYLNNLQELEFIYQKNLFPELEYVFKHALTHEVAYSSILRKLRRGLHEKIGEVIEQIYGAGLEECFEMLAFHFSRSNNFGKAYQYSKLSGQKATRNNSAWEAYGFYREAIGALKRLPNVKENREKQLEVFHLILVPIILLGLPEDSLPILREGARVSEELGDLKSLSRFYTNIGLYFSSRGNLKEGITYSGKAFEGAVRADDIESMARSGPDLCLAYLTQGDFAKVIKAASTVTKRLQERGMESETFGGPTNVYSALVSMCGFSMGMMGNFDQAMALCEKGLRESARTGRPTTKGICESYFGTLLLVKGEWDLAALHLRKSIKYLEEARFIQPLALAWTRLGQALTHLEDLETAKKHIEKGLEIHRNSGTEWFLSIHLFFLSIWHYHSGELDRARSLMEETYELSGKNHEKYMEGASLIWLGRILGKGDWKEDERAEENILSGVKILEFLGTKPDLSSGHLFLGELYGHQGRKEDALKYLNKACAMFHEMGMGYWQDVTKDLQDNLR